MKTEINKDLTTKFATPERNGQEKIRNQASFISDLALIHQLVELVPDAFLVLNKHRQIVFCNKVFADAVGITDMDKVCGLRPGEAFHCVHANEMAGGCGTTEYCIYCGAVNTILLSQKDKEELHCDECSIIVGASNSALNFRVWAKNLTIEGEDYTFFIARDISSEKRRTALERIFFHDILNTAGGIQGVVDLLENAGEEELDELIQLVEFSSGTLIEEINAQKDMLAAESGDLKLQITNLNSKDILKDVCQIYAKHEVAMDKKIAISENCDNIEFPSDLRLVKRILGNMLKNALEASSQGETVTIGANEESNSIAFWVQNPGVMPKEAQMQVFQRAYSTKGGDRGLGTYSIKLLGENYLMGKVSFKSEEGEGTVFSLNLPLKK